LKVLTFVYFSDAYRMKKGLVWVPAGRRACRGNGWVLEKGKGSISTGPEPHDNDPSAGSPTERLQRTEPRGSRKLTPPVSGRARPYLKQTPRGGSTHYHLACEQHPWRRRGRFRTWLRIAHFGPRRGASYLKLLPYPGLLARPRRGFPRALGVEVFRVSPQFDSVACWAQTSI
jgi:hypothetical protein